ncbi:MAG: peptide-methionine (S)-S-oxide reductase MsrA [Gammaproteobacteria bacterium]|nr:peptide-methionine (S)-S-oxide reductase MsrA [Gammaproteobacteria bacterium]
MPFHKTIMPTSENALPGRTEQMRIHGTHIVLGSAMLPPFPENCSSIIVGLGCFWGAEKLFWQQVGVYSTAVGYSAGFTPNPSYEEVCSGMTGHNEVVLVVYENKPDVFENVLRTFWQGHNPTQGMRQGNDVGTQYRSGIYFNSAQQQQIAVTSRDEYQLKLNQNNYGTISTEILPATEFFYAEDYHQQYLQKNPNGYCGLGGTGVCLD